MTRPVVLILSGHDPTGGAGLTADAEAVAAHGGWPVTLATAMTAQNTYGVEAVWPTPVAMLERQLSVLEADMSFDAIKVGLIADAGVLEFVARLLARYRKLPSVLDPVVTSGTGQAMNGNVAPGALRALLDDVTLVTPNTAELLRMSEVPDPERAIERLSAQNAHVLVTGTDVDPGAERITHSLFHAGRAIKHWSWPRLSGSYHGSGCTLAASCAALMAQGDSIESACARAQSYTWHALEHGIRLGGGQFMPGRFWHYPLSATEHNDD
ncbi:bifunctional hydroxymethylpyrimidine kinase/phosphomethylpyrimidine kinase [Larsenimonas suaedae]|uniref:hydroxymethylpyrimidine kinase n=1 Tax=Larsenimonas suaedae TaxID=1851019 RepID=A0ABU1GR71_9GAMM|nr:hydroxymethylpyrimidine/phosphomethylpyrimidine kinase [Larsenimonas suaedae]MCM2972714.1 hydroxymethylpyrimidine/phosphomethylpyrimidine kinase [Larsenimonas suaedae]MDR5894489.1 hydroxymethylpyrimidine/phosphomethylpyrimidine kinase [Larsenimonas suaedae]